MQVSVSDATGYDAGFGSCIILHLFQKEAYVLL